MSSCEHGNGSCCAKCSGDHAEAKERAMAYKNQKKS